MSLRNQSDAPLRWQSQALLVLILAPAIPAVAVECVFFAPASPWFPLRALGLGALLALAVWRSRAATPGAALCGGLFTVALLLVNPGWRSPVWPLLALLVLTLAATRFGHARKDALGLGEGRHGRNAAQVTANLGIAALAAIALRFSVSLATPAILDTDALRLALAAALAEAAADTLSSELGEVLGGEPRLLTTFRRVPAGTDGAISVAGSLAGVSAAVVIVVVAMPALGLTAAQAGRVLLAAIAGLLTDSWLGAVLERRGLLNNDSVNFLSTFIAALLAYWIA